MLKERFPQHIMDAVNSVFESLPKDEPETAALADSAHSRSPSVPEILSAILLTYVEQANAVIPNSFVSEPVDLFGNPNNRLDPLELVDTVSASTSGKICLPRACTSIWTPLGRKEVCVPPVAICAQGRAHAKLSRVRGLASSRIGSISVDQITLDDKMVVEAIGTMSLGTSSLSVDGSAGASGGPLGISIPASVSASAGIAATAMRANVSMSFDLARLALKKIEINTLDLSYSGLRINIAGLGVFSFALGSLIETLTTAISPIFSVNSLLARTLKDFLQKELNKLL